jgi:hypothetical protein
LLLAPAAVIALGFVVACVLELRHVAMTLPSYGVLADEPSVAREALEAREFAGLGIAINTLAAAAFGLSAFFGRRPRRWMRLTVIIAGVVVAFGVVLLFTIDFPSVYRALFVPQWFATVHYVTHPLVGTVAAAGAALIVGPDAREYFWQHRQLTEDDRRVWSTKRIRSGGEPGQ